MLHLPPALEAQISVFSAAFSRRSWRKALLLLTGALLCPGSRTVCNLLRVVGLSQERRFHKYHRFLSRDRWSAFQLARKLLIRLVETFLSDEEPLVFGIDETIERRWGRKIGPRGIYRDPVRSSASHFVKTSGLRWLSVMLCCRLPWMQQDHWALPFLTVLCPSERYYQQLGRPLKSLSDQIERTISCLARWTQPLARRCYLLGDNTYATYRLLDSARSRGIEMIVRMRLDARLFAFPTPPPPRRRGAKPKVGARLKLRIDGLPEQITVSQWYGQKQQRLHLYSGVGIWYKSGEPRVPLRWVLLEDPTGARESVLLASTDLTLAADQIVAYYLRRWRVEVTFAQVRRHLGVESQRQWSDLAIQRSTPLLLACYSLVCLMAEPLHQLGQLQPLTTAWYSKSHLTFSDVLTAVRTHIWQHNNLSTSPLEGQVQNSTLTLRYLWQVLTTTAA